MSVYADLSVGDKITGEAGTVTYDRNSNRYRFALLPATFD